MIIDELSTTISGWVTEPKKLMQVWTVENRTTIGLAVVFILLGILNLASASMTFRFSHSLSFSMLDMTLFFSVAAFIVVRRLTRILLNAKAAEASIVEQLRSQAEKHAQLIRGVEQVGESIIIFDLSGSIQYVNPAFERITGYTRTEAIGNIDILQSGQHPPSYYESIWTTLLKGDTWSGDFINRRKDGTLFNEEATISPIKDDRGTVISFVAVKREVTQELLLRNQLKQAQKMEAMGRLAGGVAHDFNNLLMVIRTYAEMMRNYSPDEHSIRGSLREVLKAVDRGVGLTSQMLAFGRKQLIHPTVLDMNEVIVDTAKMLRRIIGENIEFQFALADSIDPVETDRGQIVQVLMNLCLNARDAMPEGGILKIVTRNARVAQPTSGLPAYILDGDYVMFSVTDSGIGVGKEVQSEVFEPFFTTKRIGEGTGLGLATVYGIAKQSGGYVWLESEPGQGACFTVCLPKVDKAVTRIGPVHTQAPRRGNESVLIVEDEESLRTGFCKFLSRLGYFVLAAGSGEEALVIADRQERIDLLVTDVVLPKINGRELSQNLALMWPDFESTLYVRVYG